MFCVRLFPIDAAVYVLQMMKGTEEEIDIGLAMISG